MVEGVLNLDEQKTIDVNKIKSIRSEREEDEQPKKGEIVGGDGDTLSSSSSPRPGTAVVQHPLEHSWTFWLVDFRAMAKQVAWDCSMRPIYTFSTVQEFWKTMRRNLTEVPKTNTQYEASNTITLIHSPAFSSSSCLILFHLTSSNKNDPQMQMFNNRTNIHRSTV